MMSEERNVGYERGIYGKLERAGRAALKLDHHGEFGGAISADTASNGGAYAILLASLSPYFMDGNEKAREEIHVIIDNHSYLSDSKSISKEEYLDGVKSAAKAIRDFLDK